MRNDEALHLLSLAMLAHGGYLPAHIFKKTCFIDIWPERVDAVNMSERYV